MTYFRQDILQEGKEFNLCFPIIKQINKISKTREYINQILCYVFFENITKILPNLLALFRHIDLQIFIDLFALLILNQHSNNAYLFSQLPKMISDANLVTEEQLLFSQPQVLQQLRQHLLSLINEDNFNLEELLQGFYMDILPLFNTMEQMQQQKVPAMVDYVNQLSKQSKERLAQIVTLANLAIKMIDYIREKEENYQQNRENYQQEIDSLKSTVNFLTNRNDVIENDVQIFKSQLQAAQNQLQQIVGERQQENEDDLFRRNITQLAKQKEKDWKIENLEAQLEGVREQLHFFQFNSKSRKSLAKLVQNSAADEKQREQQCIPNLQIGNRVSLEQELYKSSQLIIWLQQQNEQLKRQIMELSQFRSQKQNNHHTILSDQQVKYDELAYRQPLTDVNDSSCIVSVQMAQDDRQLLRAVPFTIFERISSLAEFTQNNSSSQMYQQRQNDQDVEAAYQPQQDKFYLMNSESNFRALNSDWSSKSCQRNVNNLAYYNQSSAKQVFVRQKEEDAANEKTIGLISNQAGKYRVIQQTRQTQISVRQFQCQVHRLQKKFCSMGVNTMNLVQQKGARTWKDTVMSTIRSNYIYKRLVEFVIKGRIGRSERKAKIIMHKYIY